jgi:hypothetical protein
MAAKKKATAKKSAAPKPAGKKPSDFMGGKLSNSAASKRIADEAMTARQRARQSATTKSMRASRSSSLDTESAASNAYSAYKKRAMGYKREETDAQYAARMKKAEARGQVAKKKKK